MKFEPYLSWNVNTKVIKKLLIERDLKISDLAPEWGVSVSALSQTIRGKSRSARLLKLLAAALGVPLSTILVDAAASSLKCRLHGAKYIHLGRCESCVKKIARRIAVATGLDSSSFRALELAVETYDREHGPVEEKAA